MLTIAQRTISHIVIISGIDNRLLVTIGKSRKINHREDQLHLRNH